MQVEDLMQLSRPEALAMKRKIDDMLEDAADVAVVEHIRDCGCSRKAITPDYSFKHALTEEEQAAQEKLWREATVTTSKGLDYFIDAPILNE